MDTRVLAVTLLGVLLATVQGTENGAAEETEKGDLTKQVLLQKINQEKRFLIESWNLVTEMTNGFVEKMKESVQVSLLKELNQEMYAALEVAEDSLIVADEAGVLAVECVSRLEERARAMVEENIERMRICVEDEATDGSRLREAVRKAVDDAALALLNLQRKLLDCIEELEKSDPSLKESDHIKSCVSSEEVLKLTQEKEEVDKEVDKQMKLVRQKQEKGNRCLADVMEEVREDYVALKAQIRACAQPTAKQEL